MKYRHIKIQFTFSSRREHRSKKLLVNFHSLHTTITMSKYAWKWVRPRQRRLCTVGNQTSPSEVSREPTDEELDALDYVVPYMEGPSSWERIKEVNDQSYSGYKDRERWIPWMCASCNSWGGPENTCLDCGDSNTEQIRYPRAYRSKQPAFHNIYGRDDYF